MDAARLTLTWQEFVGAICTVSGQWAFRGYLPGWHHETSLERLCRAWDIPLGEAAALEARLIREFRRHPEFPATELDGDDLACLALMQHHGAPTRLLDFTYSPYVAAYFALDALFDARKNKDAAAPSAAAVWAIDVDWLHQKVKGILPPDEWVQYEQDKKKPGAFASLFFNRRPALSFVGTVTPLRLSHRLSVQQGLFLCPGDVSRSWQANLDAVTGPDTGPHIKTFLIAQDSLGEAFEGLARMNVTARSLFPGLDGYSKSLGHRADLLRRLPLPRV